MNFPEILLAQSVGIGIVLVVLFFAIIFTAFK